ncbi:hypothetical protein PR003_g25521 [Phytophthora rubi]|uniref:CCHC-type domain-containing protein n=1 Tax=Phytophthora rubi TaxID=129364 RepID=A0A6A4CE09_9STRA|nr:hypothetical protein PR001_g19364 [Phytophthora rubi]KAE9289564.1 hypothetical protein PR003_g25521 [Phytophthora rubi]
MGSTPQGPCLIGVAVSRQKAYNVKSEVGQRAENGGSGGGSKPKGSGVDEKQYEGKSNNSQNKNLKKCFICENPDHFRADCPNRSTSAGVARLKESEHKRKPRGNVTILRKDSESSDLEHTEEDVQDVTAALDEIDTGIDVAISKAIPDDEGADVVVDGEELDEPAADTDGSWWYFDNAASVHITGNRTYYSSFSDDVTQSRGVHGVTPALWAQYSLGHCTRPV